MLVFAGLARLLDGGPSSFVRGFVISAPISIALWIIAVFIVQTLD